MGKSVFDATEIITFLGNYGPETHTVYSFDFNLYMACKYFNLLAESCVREQTRNALKRVREPVLVGRFCEMFINRKMHLNVYKLVALKALIKIARVYKIKITMKEQKYLVYKINMHLTKLSKLFEDLDLFEDNRLAYNLIDRYAKYINEEDMRKKYEALLVQRHIFNGWW